ncbi:MAG: glycosyltransferase family 9 protein [bacterium]
MLKKRKINKKTKILVINFGGIGDQILFFPALKTIKASYPLPFLTLAVETRSKSAKELSSLIDEVITCDIKTGFKYFNLIKLLFKIWSGRYHVVVSSGGSKFIAIFLFLTGIRKRIGYNTGLLSKILLTKTASLNKNQYAANMYHALAKAICSDQEANLPEIDISPENLIWAYEKIGSRTKQVVTIHPGVSKLSITKNIIKFWSVSNWVSLIVKLICSGKYKVVLTGGPDDEGVLLQIKAELARYDISEDSLADLYGQTKNLSQLAALISLSNVLVCVDSAPMHISVGTRTPIVAIFGPTDEKKLLPSNDYRFIAVKDEDLDCRPCLWDKRKNSCDYIDCLNINSDKVFQTIKEHLD